MCDTCGCGQEGNPVRISRPGETDLHQDHSHNHDHDHNNSHTHAKFTAVEFGERHDDTSSVMQWPDEIR